MPTYQYRCLDCSSEHEVVQKFTDDPLTQCPTCEGTVRKVFSAVGVVFKGSGFYATDNRAKAKTSAGSSPDGKKSDAKGTDSAKGAGKAESPAGKPSKSAGSSKSTPAA